MAEHARNDLTIYDTVAADWWSDEIRWVRTLKNLVPGRMAWFDRHVDWPGKAVLDLGCAGGFMAERLARDGARVWGIDPAAQAIEAARAHAQAGGLEIGYDVGVGEALPYEDARFDVVVCVDVLEHVEDLAKVLSEVARVLRPGGCFLFDTINRNILARLATITVAEDILRLLPRGTHDPAMFIKPAELRHGLEEAGLKPGAMTGLGPRGINRRGDFTFGPLPLKAVIYMGVAHKPGGGVMLEIGLLVTALLFGGMVLYAFGFAAFVFSALPPETARPLIREAFPHFYLFVLATSAVAAGFSAAQAPVSAALLAAIAVTTIYARQGLMPAINRATDAGDTRRFKWLHTGSVLLTLAHIGAAGVVVVRLAAA